MKDTENSYAWKPDKKIEEAIYDFIAYKNRAIGMANYMNAQSDNEQFSLIIERLHNCGSLLLFRDYYKISQISLHKANFCCKHTLCPACASRRALKGAFKLQEATTHLLKENPSLKAYYMVLTVKNTSDLLVGFNHLTSSFARISQIRRDAVKAKKTSNPYKSKNAYALKSQFAHTVAAAYSIEDTYNEDTNEHHPHINILLLSEKPISQIRVSEEWKSITKDSFIVYSKPIDVNKNPKVFFEIMKYALKFSELPYSINYQVYKALIRRRLVGKLGLFRGLNLDVDLNDTPIEDEPFIEYLYRYLKDERSYELNRTRIVDNPLPN